MSGTKELFIYKSDYNGSPHLYMEWRDRTNWGTYNVGGSAWYPLLSLQAQWLRVQIQVISTTEALVLVKEFNLRYLNRDL